MNWKQKEYPFDEHVISHLAEETTYSQAFLKLCLQRNLDTIEKINDFIHQSEVAYHDPFLLYDMERAVNRIFQAIESEEAILVYGDYDADGITSTAILVEAIEELGGNVTFYLPNRFKDGYGPNERVFQEQIESGIELIVTCDNGVMGHDAIQLANEKGVDVIVTDHHELPIELPNAYAIVHPNHPSGDYPFSDLSGAGVALKLAGALQDRIPYEYFDIAAIGTIADLVSLTDENRWLVKKGLEILKQSERIGLLMLLEKAGTSLEGVDEETIGFTIGPRLNALGRLGDASPGVELLTSFDEERLEEVVEEIQQTNSKRQAIVSEIVESATAKLEQLSSLPNIIVLSDPTWHEGVLGIVASRLVEETGRPTILLAENSETGIAKGSGRSIDAVHLYQALSACSDCILKFGGHKMAAGLSVSVDQVSQLSYALNNFTSVYAEQIKQGATIEVDEYLDVDEVTLDFLNEIDQLKPFGTDNPKPIFAFKDVPAQNIKQIGADQKHLKFSLHTEKQALDVIGFNKGHLAQFMPEKEAISVIGELGINTWRDLSKPQLQLKDLTIDHVQFFDKRTSHVQDESLKIENSVYLFFNRAFFEKTADHLPNSSVSVLLESRDDIPPFEEELTNLIIIDCPSNLDYLTYFLERHKFNNYYIYAYPIQSITAEGIPNQTVFAHAYRYFRTHQNMDVRSKLSVLAQYLKIDKNLLIFIISVFLEAKFVTIDNGIMNPNPQPEKVNLEETNTYKQRINKMNAEKLFIYQPFQELIQWIEACNK